MPTGYKFLLQGTAPINGSCVADEVMHMAATFTAAYGCGLRLPREFWAAGRPISSVASLSLLHGNVDYVKCGVLGTLELYVW
jgi:hypothetical protein